MSVSRIVVGVAAAVIVVPLMLAAREGPSFVPSGREQAAQPQAADTAAIRALVAGIRGANAVQCELILQAFDGWFSGSVPDRDPAAWELVRRVRYRVVDRETIGWLAGQLRTADTCVGRVASRLLGRSESLVARATLLSALSDSSASVRRLGAVGLGFRNDSTTSANLVRALADRDAGVRTAAAWALGEVN
ncbi:MAG TPA: HEAT repeat domain-containing protein [Gemmatimonadaceae bacterium]